jgi:DNA-binding IclR family transcriptional regulator
MLFAEPDQRLGVSEIARRLEVHKSTASRLASTLTQRGLLAQDPETELISLGPALARMGLLVSSNRNLITASSGPLHKLAATTGETANVSVLDDGRALHIAQREGSYTLAARSWIGVRDELHATAVGKALAAFTQPTPAIAATLHRYTDRTITSPEELTLELVRVRRRGYATQIGEIEPGLTAVAVPILDHWGQCHGVIDVAGPSTRMPQRRLKEFAVRAKAAANEIAARLDVDARRF